MAGSNPFKLWKNNMQLVEHYSLLKSTLSSIIGTSHTYGPMKHSFKENKFKKLLETTDTVTLASESSQQRNKTERVHAIDLGPDV